MAKIAKSKDLANYRKGKDVQVGDVVEMAGPNGERQFKLVADIQRVWNGREVGNGMDYGFFDVTGEWRTQASGGEFQKGRY